MFKRINKKMKGLFSSQRMKTLALMLLVGTTAVMAQRVGVTGKLREDEVELACKKILLL